LSRGFFKKFEKIFSDCYWNAENWPTQPTPASQKENAEFSFSVGRPKSVREPFYLVIRGTIQKAP
jgi:hypothetical protein